GADEEDGDAVAGVPVAHAGADCLDCAREFVAGDVRGGVVGVVALPAVPVASAEAGGFYADDHTVLCRVRVGDLTYLQTLAVSFEEHRLHLPSPRRFRLRVRCGWSRSSPRP